MKHNFFFSPDPDDPGNSSSVSHLHEKDFLQCQFNGDATKYVANITHVNGSSFDCILLNSGDTYTFDAGSMKVTSQFGVIPMGSQLANYTLYTASDSPDFQTGGFVAVTFTDGTRHLAALTDVDASGSKSATLLDSDYKYVFDADNKVVSTDDITTHDVSAIDPYSAGSPVIVVSAGDSGTGGSLQSSASINSNKPRDSDTIVVNMQEFSSGVTNFNNWLTNSALHNTVAKPVRDAAAIKFIVLHETSGSDAGTGFDPPFTSHFVIAADEVRQFNDLSEEEWHATIFNEGAIGIEFKNPDWVRTKNTGQQYIDANWSGDYPSYTIPSTDKLENLVLLLQRLISKKDAGFPAIDPEWLQIVSYNDVSSIWEFKEGDIPSDDEKGKKKFFIYSCGIGYMTPTNFDISVTGILSHNSVSNLITVNSKTVIDEELHTDGSFQALYTWLRIMQSNSVNDAFNNAQSLVTNNVVTVNTIQKYEGYNNPNHSGYAPYSGLSARKVFLINIETML